MIRAQTALARPAARRALLCSTALQAATLVVFAAAASAQPAPNARPTGGQVVGGAASIGQTATATTINQSSQRAAIDWRSFDVGRDQTVQFNQPGASAITLNRVTGPDPSAIAGRISANGQLVITNQSGVVFHQGAQVDAASLVVSAPGITNQNFMAGRMVFDQAPHPDAQVSNAGRITVREAGLVGLVAPRVANSGVITARMGHVVLAGAEAHTVDLYGDGLLSIDVTRQVQQTPHGPDGKPVTALVTNTGTIVADGGTITLTASAADGIVQTLVDAGGRIRANGADGRTGTVVIAGVGGDVRVTGRVAADGGRGPATGQGGGTVVLNTTGAVTVGATARVTASGATGGGTVAIGTTLARATGGPAVRNQPTAATTLIESGARIAANARTAGNGGQVTILSRSATTMAGRVEATGGKRGGDGGQVEVSGDILTLTGPVSTAAPMGRAGRILLDPADFLITSAQPDGPNSIRPATLEMMTASVVTVNATGNLIAASSVNLTGQSEGGPQSLELIAGNALTVNAGVTLQAVGSVSLTAGTGGIALLGNVIALGTGAYNADFGYPVGYKGIVLSTTGAVTQGPDSVLSASNLSGNAVSAALISRNNRITNVGKDGLVFQTTGGDFTLVDSVNLVVGGGNTVGGGANAITVPDSTGGPQRTISLATDGLTLDSLNGTPIYAPSGTFALQPYTPGTVGVEVSTNGVRTAGTLSLTTTDLSNITASTLVLGSAATKSVTFGTTAAQIDFGRYGFTALVAQAAGPVSAFQTGAAPNTQYASIGIGSFAGSGASLSLPGDNDIRTLAGFATPAAAAGPVSFHTGGSLTVTGAVNGSDVTLSTSGTFVGGAPQVPPTETLRISADVTATGTLRLDTTNGTVGAAMPVVQDSNSIITAPILTGAVGPATLNNRNAIGQIGTFSSEGAVAITNANALQLTGTITAASLALNVAGAVTQPSGSLAVNTLTGTAASVALTQPTNAIFQIGNFATTQGGFSLATTLTPILGNELGQVNPLTVSGALMVPASQTVSLAADQFTIATGGSVSAVNGTVALQTLTPGHAIVLGAATVAGALSILSSDIAAITTATLQLGAASSNGNIIVGGPGETLNLTPNVTTALLLRNTGTVTEGAGAVLTVPALSAGTAAAPVASVTMNGGNRVNSLIGVQATGAIAFANAQNLAINGDIGGSGIALTTSAGGLALTSGTIATAGTLALSIVGAVTQTAGVVNVASLTGSAGSLALPNAANLVGALGPFSAPGGFALTDNEALTVAGAVNASPLALTVAGNLVINAQIGNGLVTLTANGGTITEGVNGRVAATLLTGSATSAAFTTQNQVQALGNFATGAGFLLDNAVALNVSGIVTDPVSIGLQNVGNVTLSGQVTAPSIAIAVQPVFITGITTTADIVQTGGTLNGATQVSLTSSDSIQQTGGTITAGALTGTSGTTTSLPSLGNAIVSLGSFISHGGFTLGDGRTLTVAGPVTDTVRVGLTTSGGLVLSGALTAPSVNLSATGDVTQPLGAITATATLSGNGATVALGQAGNQVNALGLFTATGDFSLSDGQTLNVTGAASVGTGRTLSLTADVIQLQPGGSLSAPGGTVALAPLSTGQAFALASFVPSGTAAAITASTLRVGSASSGLVTIDGAFTLPTVTTLDLRSGAGITETAAGSVGVNTLIGTVAGPVTLTSANAIGTLGAFTSQGGFALRNVQALTVAGPLTDTASIGLTVAGPLTLNGTLTAPSIALSATGDITQPGGALVASVGLTGNAATATLAQAGNRIASLGTFTATGDFSLSDGQVLNVTGAVSAGTGRTLSLAADTIQLQPGARLSTPGGTVVLAPLSAGQTFTLSSSIPASTTDSVTADTLRVGAASSGPVIFASSFNLANVGTLDLRSGGGVTETAAASIAVSTLTGTVSGTAALGATAIANLGAFTASGDFSLSDSQALSVTGLVAVGTGRTLALTADTIRLRPAGGLAAPGGTVALAPLTPGSQFSLSSFVPAGTAAAITASTLRVGSASSGPVTIDGPFLLPNVATLDLRSGAGATETATGSVGVNTLIGTVAGPVTLTSANAVGTLGAFTSQGGFALRNAQALTVAGPLTDTASIGLTVAGALTLNGTLTAPSIALSATGDITQPGGALVASVGLTGNAATATLAQAGNRIASLGTFTATGDFSLSDGQVLNVTGAVSAGTSRTLSLAADTIQLQRRGSLTAPGGTVALAPLSTGQAFTLASFVPTGTTAAVTAGTLRVGSAASGPVTIDGVFTLPNVTTLDLRSGAGVSETAAGSIGVNTLTGTVAGSVGLTSTNSVAILGAFTSGGDFTLVNGGQLAINGAVAAGSGRALTLVTPEADFAAGGSLAAPSGTVSITAPAAASSLTLRSTAPLGGPSQVTSATFAVAAAGPITFDGAFYFNSASTVSSIGAVAETPGSSIVAPSLGGTAGSLQLGGANQIGRLAGFASRGDLVLATTTALDLTGTVSAGGAIALTSGDLRIGLGATLPGLISTPGQVTLVSSGTITEPNGTISAGTLSGSGTVVTLTGNNAVQSLNAFTALNLTLNDLGSLNVAGPVSAGNVVLTTTGDISLTGDVSTGVLQVNAGGTIVQSSGTLNVLSLTGSANHLASFGDTGGQGTANVAQLGAFSLVGSTLTLLDSRALTVVGPLTSGNITITAPDNLTLAGGQIGSDNAALTATGGGQLVQLNTTVVAPLTTTTGSLRLGGANISLANLQAGNEIVSLTLGAGTATGALTAAGLAVSGSGGGANLTGTVAGQTGFDAAYVSTITPAVSQAYQINACAIASVSCAPIVTPIDTHTTTINSDILTVTAEPPPVEPAGTVFIVSELIPKSFYDTLLGATLKTNLFTTDLITLAIVRDPTDPNLVLPNISDRDY